MHSSPLALLVLIVVLTLGLGLRVDEFHISMRGNFMTGGRDGVSDGDSSRISGGAICGLIIGVELFNAGGQLIDTSGGGHLGGKKQNR